MRYRFKSFLNDFLFDGIDRAFICSIFSGVYNLSYGKLNASVVEKDVAEFSDFRHCLSLGADAWEALSLALAGSEYGGQ